MLYLRYNTTDSDIVLIYPTGAPVRARLWGEGDEPRLVGGKSGIKALPADSDLSAC
jgi:hypothetical protein